MVSSKTLMDVLKDGRGWDANTIDPSDSWVCTLSEFCLSTMKDFIGNFQGNFLSMKEECLGDKQHYGFSEYLDPVLNSLNFGRGFAVLEKISLERFSIEEALFIYWIIGQFFGKPLEQDINGSLLYDVRDTGQDVGQGARFSLTNSESSFHTDNAFGTSIPDFIGLLCLQKAKSGGQSQLVSAIKLHNELVEDHPDVLETLYKPFFFDRRGQFRAGEDPVSQFPICSWNGQELTFRYLNYYIQVGHRVAGVGFSQNQRAALEILEELLCCPKFRVEFDLLPGQILLTNNRWILHNRTAFIDHIQEKDRRHFVRLWLRRKEARE